MTLTLPVANFRTVKTKTPEQLSIGWGDMVSKLTKHAALASKSDAPLFSCVAYKPDRMARGNDNVDAVSALVLDYDDGTRPEDVSAYLGDYEHVIYSTYSHTAQVPKFRAVVPFEAPISPDLYRSLWGALYAHIPHKPDKACKDPARIFYYPSAPADRLNDAIAIHNPGELFSLANLATPAPVEAAPAVVAVPDEYARAEDALRYIDPDIGYADWLRIGMALHSEFGDGGLTLWDAWSANGSKYEGPQMIDQHWRSFRGDGVKIGTLYAMAKEGGFCTKQVRSAPPLPVISAKPYSIEHYMRRGQMPNEKWLDLNERGKPKGTLENCQFLLEHYEVTVRYNVIKKSVEINIPGESFSIDNYANVTLAHINSIACRNGYASEKLPDYIKAIADKNSHNPVARWIESSPWDGVDRLEAFFDTILSNNEALKRTLLFKWAVSAVAALYQHDKSPFSAHGVLVLQGEQAMGKTSWVRRLLPDMMSQEYIRTGMHLDPADKDHIVGAITNWIVELGELGSTMRKDVDRLKAFLTNCSDRVRRPYDRMESEYQRRTVFCSSVNERQFLKDDTGNRRFWVIECLHIDYAHDINQQQLWAQILKLYRDGAQWWLSTEELGDLNNHVADYMEHDPIEELMLSNLDWSMERSGWRKISATGLLAELGLQNPSRGSATQAGKYLTKHCGPSRRSGSGRWFLVPPKKLEFQEKY